MKQTRLLQMRFLRTIKKLFSVILLFSLLLSHVGETSILPVLAQENTRNTLNEFTYVNERYGYSMRIFADWYLYAGDSSAEISLTTICNYPIQNSSGKDVERPINGLCMQLGVGELEADQTFNQWVEKRQLSETDASYVGQIGILGSAIARVNLESIEGAGFILNQDVNSGNVLEINIPFDPYVISVGINRYDSEGLSDALSMLSTIEFDSTNVNLEIPESMYETGPQIQTVTPWLDQSYSIPNEIDSLILDLENTVEVASHQDIISLATDCSVSGAFDWGEAPTTPLEIWMPFKDGERWRVGGDGSFYGNWAHGNCYNDYYATDWNRDGDFQADVLPVANGEITAYVSPCATTGLGCSVTVTHSSGIRTVYGHLDSVIKTSGGVNHWQTIGKVGQSGTNSPHLHLSFRKYDTNGYYSRCNSGVNNGKCPNGENPQWPQSPRPSPINTQSGSQPLVDGNYYTSNNKESGSNGTGQDCGQVSYNGVILYEHATCNKDQNGVTKAFSSATGWIDIVSDPIHDKASSIYVASGWSIKVFEAAISDGNGRSWRCIDHSMWDLNTDYYTNGDVNRKINDDISSVQVYNNSSCSGGSSPNVPSNLRNTSSTQTSITMTWDDVSNETGYKIYQWNGSSFVYMASVSANVITYTETRSSCGWTNRYAVTAYNGYGESALSDWEDGSTQSCPTNPDVPSLVSPGNNATVGRFDGVTLDWNSANAATQYYAEFWGGPNFNLNSGWVSSTEYFVGSSFWGGTYQWRVKSRNSNNVESNWSETRTLYRKYGTPSSLTSSGVSQSQVTLSWGSSADAPGNIDGYRIYRGGAAIATVGSSILTYTNTGLNCATPYSYAVKAYKGNLESDASNTVNITTNACPTVPATPTNFRITASMQKSITIAWDNVSDETGYKIYEWNGADFVYLTSVGANVTSFTETRAACGWDEYYEVSAYNGNGESVHANWIHGYTLPCTPVLSLPGKASTNPWNYDLNFQWNAANGATNYLVEWWGGPYTTMQPCNGIEQTSCHIGVVVAGNTYSWHVKARNSAGDSPWSETWTFTIQAHLVPDLVVQSITVSPSSPIANQPVTFTVRVKNQGTSNITSAFYVDLYVDNQPGSCPSDGLIYKTVNSLAAGATTDLTYAYSGFPASGSHTVSVFADSYCSVTETNEDNNITNVGVTVPDLTITTLTVPSTATSDGWVLESTETSNAGSSLNRTATTLSLGDNAANKQYRAILSFDTSALPENAIITSVRLKFKHSGVSGTNPFTTHGNLIVDVRKGSFNNNAALQATDFQGAASKNKVLVYTNNLVDNWYSKTFLAADFQYINLVGTTQFRLRFSKDDNNDRGADLLKIVSGEGVDQPQLVIEYYIP